MSESTGHASRSPLGNISGQDDEAPVLPISLTINNGPPAVDAAAIGGEDRYPTSREFQNLYNSFVNFQDEVRGWAKEVHTHSDKVDETLSSLATSVKLLTEERAEQKAKVKETEGRNWDLKKELFKVVPSLITSVSASIIIWYWSVATK